MNLVKAIVPIRKSVLFRLALIAILLLVAPAAVTGYLFYTSQPEYLMAKGLESLGHGNLDQAKQMADRLQRKGDNSAAHILRGKVFLAQARTQLEQARLPFPYEGMQLATQIVLSGAELPAYPPALRGPGWLAAIQVQQPFPRHIPGIEDLLEALGEFTQVLDNDPWAVQATVLGAECLVRLGDYRSALLALATVVYRQPDNLDAHRYLAAIYMDVNAATPLARHLREWIRLDPNNPLPYRWLSRLTRDSEAGFPEAMEAYTKLLQLDQEDSQRASDAFELAEIQMNRLGEHQRALDTLANAPKDFQGQPSFIILRAECLLGLGKVDEAKRLVDGVLKEHPTLSGALLFRARIHLQDDQPQAAIALLEKLLLLHPHNGRARQTLMLAYRSIGDEKGVAEQKRYSDELKALRKRVKDLQPQVANQPWNAQARLEMAKLNSDINHSEALAWIRFAFASDPEDPEVRRTWTQLFGYRPPLFLREFQRRRQARTN
jgi:tetratricopeptide (TPR) repeat protein